jgi:hypothetical protein
MPAPLYSRWRRNFEKVFKKAGLSPAGYLHLKNKLTVYSLSEDVTRELGKQSLEIGRINWLEVAKQRLPHKAYFVEMPWRAFMTNLMTVDDENTRPSRCAFIFLQDPGGWGMMYLLNYPNGGFYLLPFLTVFRYEPRDQALTSVVMGIHYPPDPVLQHMYLDGPDIPHEKIQGIIVEMAGWVRMGLTMLHATQVVTRPRYQPNLDAEPQQKRADREVIDVDEVDMFLTPRTYYGDKRYEPNETPRHVSRHNVRGHWMYRRDRDDPYSCDIPSGQHDWEGDDQRQTCINCGQRRWFREECTRGSGDEKVKIRNVRL